MVMKKYLIIMAAALVALASCGKGNLNPEEEIDELPPISFNLTAKHPGGTKAVKTGWEDGDALFIFFNNVAAPKYLKMVYNGETWTSYEKNGDVTSPGCLGLKNGDSGSMRALYLPFGVTSISASGTSFVFSNVSYTYYLTATLNYTVVDNKVNGAFDMQIPDGYVQFFIEDPNVNNGPYYGLATDAVIPVGVESIDANGSIIETSDKVAGDDMRGFPDKGGWLFSGVLNNNYAYKNDGRYYFAKTWYSDNIRQDYYITGKTLASHNAVKLPAIGNSKWQTVGSDVTVTLKTSDNTSLGTWYTCNFGQRAPESLGTLMDFESANQQTQFNLPNKAEFERIVNNCTWTRVSIKGEIGYVVQAAQGFIFLPTQTVSSVYCKYWTSEMYAELETGKWYAWFLEYSAPSSSGLFWTSTDQEYAMRCIKR